MTRLVKNNWCLLISHSTTVNMYGILKYAIFACLEHNDLCWMKHWAWTRFSIGRWKKIKIEMKSCLPYGTLLLIQMWHYLNRIGDSCKSRLWKSVYKVSCISKYIQYFWSFWRFLLFSKLAVLNRLLYELFNVLSV